MSNRRVLISSQYGGVAAACSAVIIEGTKWKGCSEMSLMNSTYLSRGIKGHLLIINNKNQDGVQRWK